MDKILRKKNWKQDPEAVKANILKVAVEQFAQHGLAGARVDEIARQTASSKRMIYYYFSDKEGLYQAALESEYQRVRASETELNLEGLNPIQAMRHITEYTYDYHRCNPNFVRMIAIENIHNAAYLKTSEVIRDLNSKIVKIVEEIYNAGIEQGLFHDASNALQLHWMMSALCFYNVSNKSTFEAGFGAGLHSAAGQSQLRDQIVTTILRTVVTDFSIIDQP